MTRSVFKNSDVDDDYDGDDDDHKDNKCKNNYFHGNRHNIHWI